MGVVQFVGLHPKLCKIEALTLFFLSVEANEGVLANYNNWDAS